MTLTPNADVPPKAEAAAPNAGAAGAAPKAGAAFGSSCTCAAWHVVLAEGFMSVIN